MLKYNEFLLEGLQEVKKLITNQYSIGNFNKVLFDNNDEKLRKIISLDPTSNLEKDKVGKYSKWLVKMWVKNEPLIGRIVRSKTNEDDYKIIELLSIFDKNKSNIEKNNIFDYKTIDELSEVVKEFTSDDFQNLSNDIQDDVKEGLIKIFFNSDKWTIVIPQNKEASCKYGVNTKWCTAKQEHNAWDSYKSAPLYIFLDKKNELKPTYQFHFKTKQFMDVNDRSIDIKDFFLNNLDIYDRFFPIVKKKLDNKETLTADELIYIPKSYLDVFLTYFDNKLLDVLSDLQTLEDSEELQKIFIGFDEFEKEFTTYSIIIKKFDTKKLKELFDDIEEDSIRDFYKHDSGSLYDDMYGLYGYNGDEEVESLLDNILNADIKLKFRKMCELAGLDIKLNKSKDYLELMKTLKIYEKFNDDVFNESISQRAENFGKLLEEEVKEIPFSIDDYDGLDFYIEHVKEYITTHPEIVSLEQLLKSTEKEVSGIFTYDNYNEIKYRADYDVTELLVPFNELLDNVIEDLEDYGSDSEYMIGNENIIKALNFLRSKNLEKGDTVSRENKSMKIIDITVEGKLIVEISEGWKKKKYTIEIDEFETYLQNYQLHLEGKILNFNQYLSKQ